MPGLLVGYAGTTHLLHVGSLDDMHYFIENWRGEPVQFVRTADEALAAVGIGNPWVARRLECEQYILRAIREAMRYKGAPVVFAREVFPFQHIYQTERGLTRFMTNMVKRRMLRRLNRTGYMLPDEVRALAR
jgi:hypothetical protein